VYLARFTLGCLDPLPKGVAELVHDIIWAHLPEDHGLEHVTVTATAHGIELVFFLNRDVGRPVAHSRRLIAAVASASPVFAALRGAEPP
jgi:hypothetical protein